MKSRVCSTGSAILLGVVLLGCSPESRKIESKMVRHIESCRAAASCRIALGDVTNFDWDRCYVFKYTVSQQDREKALGVPDPGFRELARQMVFMKAGQIVHQEVEPTNVEHPIRDEVVFDIPDDSGFKSYGRSARFSVSKEESAKGAYYLLAEVP